MDTAGHAEQNVTDLQSIVVGHMHAVVYAGATMAVGNGYSSRVNAMQQRSLGGQSHSSTPREYSSNRFYPGSEKSRQQSHNRFGRDRDDYDDGYHAPYTAPYTAPAPRWRR